MTFKLAALIEFLAGLLQPQPVREPIPIRVDRHVRHDRRR